MAVYTHIAESEVAVLLTRYDIGALQSFAGISEGVENTNYALTTTQGDFILTVFEKRTSESDLPFFMALMAHLAACDFPAPRPIATREGEVLIRVHDKPAAIVTKLAGDWPRRTAFQHCAAVGDALGRMHVALADFAPTRANGLGPAAWDALIRPRLADAEALCPGLGALIARDLDDVRAAWPSDLPRGAIHADLFPDNALFVGERLTGVIDFYFACTDYLAYDIGVCLNAWCFVGERDYNIAREFALLEAYERHRPLTPAERAALPLMARGAALRFFATRLADWSATPTGALVKPKDPLEYADKLAWHRKAKAADYGG